MSSRLKALGLGLLAAMAVSAVAVIDAAAEAGGHFVSDVDHMIVAGSEGGAHNTKFSVEGGTSIECLDDSYTGVIGATTVAGFTVTPHHKTCKTEGGATHNVTVTMNGCTYTFKATEKTHATFWFLCAEKPIEIHHPNCTIKIPAQLLTGASYTTVVENGKHALTVDFTIENITTHYHGGICIFLGTNHKGALKGSITLKGADTAGNPVNITAT